MYTVALTGHRPSKLPCGYEKFPGASDWGKRFLAALLKEIKSLVQQHGEVTVLSGMALGADQLWALAALEAKAQHLPVHLVACVPCHNYEAKWFESSKVNYRKILAKADSVVFVHDGPYNFKCLDERNRYMVDRADLLFAIFDGSPSGTANCVRYAHLNAVPVKVFSPSSF